MPIYDYHCSHCHGNFEEFAKMKDSRKRKKCPRCGQWAAKVPSVPNLVTDTNFWGQGIHHVGACDPDNQRDVLTDRADYKKRLEEKGLRELDKAELANPKMPKPQPCM